MDADDERPAREQPCRDPLKRFFLQSFVKIGKNAVPAQDEVKSSLGGRRPDVLPEERNALFDVVADTVFPA